MLKRLLESAQRLANRPVNPYGLCVFRVLFFSVMLAEIIQLFYFRHLIFDPVPYIKTSWLSNPLVWIPWFVALGALLLGTNVRVAGVVNYIYAVIVLGHSIEKFLYHMDWYMIQVSLCFLFMPIDACFSLRTWRRPELRKRVAAWCPALLVFGGLYVVYADSVIHKFGSEMWMEGLSLWLPSSLPFGTHLELLPILDSEVLIRGMSYFVFAFEASFCVLVFVTRIRLLLVFFGFCFHMGIAVLYPIPFFGAGVAVMYALLIPASVWDRFFVSVEDDEVRGDLGSKGVKALVSVVAFAVIIQSVFLVFKADVARNAVATVTGEEFLKKAESKLGPGLTLCTRVFGIAPHWVYVDAHFRDYNHVIAVTYRTDEGEVFLPIITREGHAGWYVSGRQWVHWTFRANGPDVRKGRLLYALRSFTAFWAHKHGVDLVSGASFDVVYKRIDFQFKWKPGLIREAKALPWKPLGTVTWKKGKCSFDLPADIEAMP